ncbi:MAG TPA: hypothetical protein VGA61_13395, partial [Anaerolineae bacterium]
GLWLAYLVAARCLIALKTLAGSRLVAALAVPALLFNLTLVAFLPPVHSADLYNYAMYGRLAIRYGLNPYLVSGRAVPDDPAVKLAAWPDETSRYGPAWTLAAAGVSAVAGNDPLAIALAFKALAAAASLGAAVLIARLARRLAGAGPQALLLFAWNPLVLIETAGNGHNDIFMIFLALLGLWLYLSGRRLGGTVALVLSALVKYLTGLLFLLVLVQVVARPRTWRDRAAAVLPMLATAALSAAVCYAPFWAGPANIRRLLFGLAPGLNSLPNPIRMVLDRLAFLALGRVGGQALPATADQVVTAVLQFGFALLIAGYLVRVLRGGSWLSITLFWGTLTLVCLVLVYAAQYPWYLISPLAPAAIAAAADPGRAGKRLFAWSAAFGFVFGLFYVLLVPI